MDTHAAFAQSMSLPAGALAGQATFSGCLAKLELPVDALAAVVPAGATLAANDGSLHSCLIAFGEQAEGTTFFGGWPMPWGICYHELLVGIPLAACPPLAGPQLFVAGMTCDFWPAVWNGNVYYGFRKRFAAMTGDAAHFMVMNEDGAPVFTAFVDVRASADRDALGWIQSTVSLPVLGKRDDGVLVHSAFAWDFSGAGIEPASLSVAVRRGFEELPEGAQGQLRSEHAYAVRRMRWGLGWPSPAVPVART